ncbi:Aspartyl protease family protein [Citrus sinensis]|uniref:aspartyl protease family protein At5g10770-like n=1 Tax=Citrus clementina TaxID=85681 RepID=UPI000CECF988|nr:aspartyl protease family protein At5g10770-like isoform X1 [Citrus sinensis]XP_024034220.1 aspartyl protease family protein At5g10770-like [Citrus x clementina]KAH9760205.1 Aspartyl protease family protein [Citrus sinensis]
MWILFKVFLLFIWLLCSSNNGAYANDNDFTHSHIVSVSDLLPPTVCNRTRTALPQGPGKASLEVVSKYGPCSRLNKGMSTHTPPLRKGRQRFHSENSRRLQKAIPDNYLQKSKSFQFPAKINNTAVDEYYIVVAIGEPKQYVSLLLDTGSDLTWTQCKPCIHCSQQRDPFFDPSKSKTFSKIPCNSASCRILRKLLPPNGQDNCSSEECPYNIAYADNSSDGGFWAADRITIQEANRDGYFSWYPFLLGCTNNNTGDQNGASGIMGLDRSPISIISQTNTSYFSYCLPSPYGSTGYITFGRPDAVNSKFIKYTPIITTPEQSEYYDITITGISVGGEKLPFNSTYITKLSAIIDSGNEITRLPSPIYAALRSAFRKRMMKYKKTKADDEDDFDTCYDLSAYETVVVPKITFHFLGGVDLELDVRGTLVVFSVSQVCLAFAIFPSDPNSISLGNVQQRGYEVHYDVAGRRLGFGPGNCS